MRLATGHLVMAIACSHIPRRGILWFVDLNVLICEADGATLGTDKDTAISRQDTA
jgi:hypothetical protein